MSRTIGAIGSVLSILLAVFVGTGVALADNYHYGDTLRCADCHISHASAQHDSLGAPQDAAQPPAKHLSNAPTTNEVCLKCHDGQPGTPDVSGADVNNPSERYDGKERAAGQFSDALGDNWKGHNLSGQGAVGLQCTDCHDPHGNRNYRNLKGLDGDQDGPLAFINPLASGLHRYERANIGYARNIGDKLCGRCHDAGDPDNTVSQGRAGHYHRHPSTSAKLIVPMDVPGAHADSLHWVAGSGSGFDLRGQAIPRVPFAVSSAASFADATTVSASNEVFCLSCHKAHGSMNPFGMTWPYGGSGAPELSSSGCNQCHNVSGV